MSDGDDLERTVADLAETLEELRAEMEAERQPSRVRDLLRFTEQYTIPAVIAVLEANVRLLEMLAGAIRAADGRLDEEAERTADRALDALDGALVDVRDALAGTPENQEARRLLEEARDLRSEAERRIEERSTTDRETHEVPVDVEAELESIKREFGERDDGHTSSGDDGGE